jgi:hypothetical protein
MEKIYHSRKGRIMNIKEHFHIYSYKHNNKLIDYHSANGNNHEIIRFDIAIAHIDTLIDIAHARTRNLRYTILPRVGWYARRK